MAIYKVTNNATGETVTKDEFHEEFRQLNGIQEGAELNAIQLKQYSEFEEELAWSKYLQKSLDLTVEPVDTIEAIEAVRSEVERAAELQRAGKARLQKYTATALAEVKDDKDTKANVEAVLTAGRQAPVNVKKWFEAKGNKPAAITHVKLGGHVESALDEIAADREAKRAATST